MKKSDDQYYNDIQEFERNRVLGELKAVADAMKDPTIKDAVEFLAANGELISQPRYDEDFMMYSRLKNNTKVNKNSESYLSGYNLASGLVDSLFNNLKDRGVDIKSMAELDKVVTLILTSSR